MSITNVGHGQVLTFNNSTATKGPKGDTGVTFVPEINDGILSFQNDGQLPNPGSVDLGSYAIPAESELATARTAHDGTALPSLKEAMDYNYDELSNQMAIDEARILTLENRANSNEARLDVAEPQITALQADAVSLDGRLDAAEPKITSLETQMAAEKPKIATLQSEMAAEKPKTVTLQSDMTAEKAKIVTLQGDSASHKSRLDTAEPKITSLETQMAAEKPKIATLQSEMAAEKPKTATLQSDMSAEKAKIVTLQSDVATEKPKVATLQSDMTAEKAKIVTLQSDNTTNKANITALQSGKADKLMATNLVTNGDFSNGTTGWSGVDAVVGGVAEKTATAQHQAISFYTSNPTSLKGCKIYVAAKVKSDSNLVALRLTDAPNYNVSYQLHTGSNTFERLSVIGSISNATTVTCVIQEGRTSGFTKFYADDMVMINLTQTFGAGNEPSLAEMDLLMSQFSNSWFDGTQELQSIKQLEKRVRILEPIVASKADKLMATNLVTNGDFSNGTTGWSSNPGIPSVSNGVLAVTMPSSGDAFDLTQTVTPQLTAGKYYIRFNYKLPSDVQYLSVRLRDMTAAVYNDFGYASLTPVETMNTYSNVTSLTSYQGAGRLYVTPKYINASLANGKTIEFDNITVINLTATFGAGNEPSLAEMDLFMSQFSNSWFDGTQEILPIKSVESWLTRKADKLMATNALRNQTFTSTAGIWSGSNTLISINNGEIISTVSGVSVSISVCFDGLPPITPGRKYYFTCMMYPFRSHTAKTYINSNTYDVGYVYANTWNRVSFIHASTETKGWYTMYDNGNSATDVVVGAVTKYKYPIAIDLTATFGAGNEPTLAEMDLLMSQFSNSWFDGTQELLSLKAIQKELSSKANITQEAWITPTLLNGATGTVQYRRNSTGRIEFRGTLYSNGSALAFQLLTTHRPLDDVRFAVKQTDSGDVDYKVLINALGGVYITVTAGKFAILNAISIV